MDQTALGCTAAEYFDRVLKPRFGLAAIVPISRNARGEVWYAQEGRHRRVVKLYPAARAPVARRTAVLHTLLQERGVPVPRLLGSDLGARRDEPETASLVFELAGVRLQAGPPDDERALTLLGQLHRQAAPDLAAVDLDGVTREGPTPLEVAPLPRASALRDDRPAARFRALSDESGAPSGEASERIARHLERAWEAAEADSPTPVLLHGDYRPANLARSADGTLSILDWDEARTGSFHTEAGRALLRCLWGTTGVGIDRFGLAALFRHPRLRRAEAAYLKQAPAAARDAWAQHRETALLDAYLLTIARLRARSADATRYSRGMRTLYRVQARARWMRATRHLTLLTGR